MTIDIGKNDLRETLYNNRATGPAWQIQLPREAATRLHGLVVDLDANLIKPNPWFPPADTATAFYAGIAPALARHPILQHAEIRDTGRWLHAIVWFREPVELRSAADQVQWTRLHKVLMASVPSDPAATALICMTRPVGSVNSKTGGTVATLKPATPVASVMFEEWAKQMAEKPFELIAFSLFGEKRITPCPYCAQSGTHLGLGDRVGFCYGPCKHVAISRLFEPFMIGSESTSPTTTRKPRQSSTTRKTESISVETGATQVTAVNRDIVVSIDPAQVDSITIRVKKLVREQS